MVMEADMSTNRRGVLRGRLEDIAQGIKSSPTMRFISELTAYTVAYANGAFGYEDGYAGYETLEPNWMNPAVLWQTAGPLGLEMVADVMAGRNAEQGKPSRGAEALKTGVKVAQYGIAAFNVGVALSYTPLIGAGIRALGEAIGGPGTAQAFDDTMLKLYGSTNPTVPLGIAAANFYAARD